MTAVGPASWRWPWVARPAAPSSASKASAKSGSGELVDPALERVLLSLRSIHDALWHHLTLPLPDAVDAPLALYEALCAVPLDDGGELPWQDHLEHAAELLMSGTT